MLTFTGGNLLEADVEALVNTVNTVGVMGKGIALQFKQAFPSNYVAYRDACKAGAVEVGQIFVHDIGQLSNPRYILNFPTKQHWRSRSRVVDIETGLANLQGKLRELEIGSVAIPPLGCGNGGLAWDDVRPMIVEALGDVDDVQVLVFSPEGAPPEVTMPVRTTTPTMTQGRAAPLVLADHYDELGLGVSHIELHKLMYFLQEAGEPLRLRYAKGHYGPYADNLNHVLERLEGHFVRGFGDRTKSPESAGLLTLDPQAVAEAERFVAGNTDASSRIRQVLDLVAGFDSPYGLELLATLHWLAAHDGIEVERIEDLADGLRSWSERKGRIFCGSHIEAAWERLRGRGWAKQLSPA
jgi:O-acetyl-ADP-ribose deacetylase (regulator of RNase III)